MITTPRSRVKRTQFGILLVGTLCVLGWSNAHGSEAGTLRAARHALNDAFLGLAEVRYERVLKSPAATLEEQAEALLGKAEVFIAQGRIKDVWPDVDRRAGQLGQLDAYRLARARLLESGSVPEAALAVKTPAPTSRWYAEHVELQLRVYQQLKRWADAINLAVTAEALMPPGPERSRIEMRHLALLVAREDWSGFQEHAASLLNQKSLSSNQTHRVRLWQETLKLSIEGGTGSSTNELAQLAQSESLAPELRADAWTVLALHQAAKGKYVKSVHAFEKAEFHIRDPKDRAAVRIQRAKSLVAANQLEPAGQLLRDQIGVLGDDDNIGRGLLMLGETYAATNSFELSVKTYREFLEFFTNPGQREQAHIGLAWSLILQEQFDESALLFEKLSTDAGEAEHRKQATYKLADAWFGAEKFEKARKQYSRFLKSYPGDDLLPQAMYQEALCATRIGSTDEAVDAFQRLQAAFPGSVYAQKSVLQIGYMYQEKADWDQAEGVYDRYLSRFPNSPQVVEVRLQRGMVAQRRGDHREARKRYQDLIDSFPVTDETIMAEYLLAYLDVLNGTDEGAVKRFKDFAQMHPESPLADRARLRLGQMFFNKQSFEEAETVFMELVEKTTDKGVTERALYWAGRAAFSANRFQKALEHFNGLAERFPESPRQVDVLYWQGDTLAAKGDYETALLVFESIVKDHPKSGLRHPARIRKGDVQVSLGGLGTEKAGDRFREAINTYELVLKDVDVPAFLKLQVETKLAETLRKISENDRALVHLSNVVYDYTGHQKVLPPGSALWFTRAAFTAAEIFESRKMWTDAIHIYERVVSAGVDTAGEAKARIKRIKKERWNSPS